MDSDSVSTSDRRTDNTVTVTVDCVHDAVQEMQTNHAMYNIMSTYIMFHDVCSSAMLRNFKDGARLKFQEIMGGKPELDAKDARLENF